MREELLSTAMRSGVLLEPRLVDYLATHENPMDRLLEILETVNPRPLVLTLEEFESLRRVQPPGQTGPRAEALDSPPPRPSPGEVHRREYDPEVEILKDITGRSTCTGDMKDFARYFEHRYRTLSAMLKRRRELLGAVPIGRAMRMTKEVRFIGIVQAVKRTRAGHKLLQVEDEKDACQVLIPSTGPVADENALPDEVIGVVGRPWKSGIILAEAIVRPEVPPSNAFEGADVPLCAAFVSDLHVGSRLFLRERWAKFIRWTRSQEASRIKYLIVVGDAVDGIGVYPRQDEDLELDDVYAQYEEVSRALEDVPDEVQVIILPGNHDAVRPAEPQPALPPGIQELFPDGYIFLGNPASLRLHGVDVLCYHGRSMDDLVTGLPGMSYDRPLAAMIEMLRRRHLAPFYGGKTPLAPERWDHMIIDTVPSIFATGHVHGLGVGEYRGVKLVNSSTWQAQTSYQRMHNIVPRPGMVPIVDLQTGEAFVKAF
ncbi:MAG: DNA-directed DNA polymerase II small subunit [Thermoplasmata archaeon]